MKTTKILGATTLAGALLFTEVNANAAENVSKSQAENSVQELVSNNNNFNPKEGTKYVVMDDKYADPNRPENTYSVAFGEEPNQSPSFLYVNKDTGNIYDHDGNLVQKASVNSEDTTPNNSQSSQTTDNTDNTVNTPNNEQQQTQTTDNNTTAQTNTNTQEQAKVLPETGESTNTTIVTMIASVLLAAGSLLTFKRFSKTSK